jgi:hypothetical protein
MLQKTIHLALKVAGLAFGGVLGALSVGECTHAGIMLQPGEAESGDTFVYEFLPTFNLNSSGFGGIVGVSRSDSGHNLNTLLRFDFSGATLQAGDRVTVNVFAVDGTSLGFPFSNPSVLNPIVVDLYANTSDWDEEVVSWNTRPSVSGTLTASAVITGINEWVSFDITDLAWGWVSGSEANFGMTLIQRDVVINGGAVAGVFASSAASDDSLRPFVAAVPEPAGLGLIVVTGWFVAGGRRMRRLDGGFKGGL